METLQIFKLDTCTFQNKQELHYFVKNTNQKHITTVNPTEACKSLTNTLHKYYIYSVFPYILCDTNLLTIIVHTASYSILLLTQSRHQPSFQNPFDSYGDKCVSHGPAENSPSHSDHLGATDPPDGDSNTPSCLDGRTIHCLVFKKKEEKAKRLSNTVEKWTRKYKWPCTSGRSRISIKNEHTQLT